MTQVPDLEVMLDGIACPGCQLEVPLSEAHVPEAADYVAYFWGLDCYAWWRNQAERSLDLFIG